MGTEKICTCDPNAPQSAKGNCPVHNRPPKEFGSRQIFGWLLLLASLPGLGRVIALVNTDASGSRVAGYISGTICMVVLGIGLILA